MTITVHQHESAIEQDRAGQRRVRVWFGAHVVCEYTAPAAQAERYAEAMRQRFFGLQVTVDKSPADSGLRRLAALPRDERLWELTP